MRLIYRSVDWSITVNGPIISNIFLKQIAVNKYLSDNKKSNSPPDLTPTLKSAEPSSFFILSRIWITASYVKSKLLNADECDNQQVVSTRFNQCNRCLGYSYFWASS